MSGNRWTDSEISKLERIAKGEKLNLEGRSQDSIRRKIWELNLKPDRLYIPWTKEEIDLLKAGKAIRGRSQKTIERKRISLGIHKRKSRFEWTQRNVKALERLCKQGHSARDIFKMNILPKKFSIDSIQKKMCRLGLAKTNPKKYPRFREHVRLKFESFLKERWRGKLPQELADQWNIGNHQFQVGRRKVIYYLSKLDIKVSCYEIGRIKRLREAEEKIKSSKFNSSKKASEEIRSKRVEMMQKRYQQKKDIWTGYDLEKTENSLQQDLFQENLSKLQKLFSKTE